MAHLSGPGNCRAAAAAGPPPGDLRGDAAHHGAKLGIEQRPEGGRTAVQSGRRAENGAALQLYTVSKTKKTNGKERIQYIRNTENKDQY